MKGFFITGRSSGEIPQQISHALTPRPRPWKNKERVKIALDYIKQLHKDEQDREVKKLLAAAGLALNSVLIKREYL